MKILFIHENAISESIGICALSAYLKERGHTSDLILTSHSDDIVEDVRKMAPDVLAFTLWTGMQHPVYDIIQTIKKRTAVSTTGNLLAKIKL